MSSKSIRSSARVREEIGVQEGTIQIAKKALEDLLAPGKQATSLKDRIRGFEGTILQICVDSSKAEQVMKLGAKLGEARKELLALEPLLPREEKIKQAEERVRNSVRYLSVLRTELADAEGQEALAEVRSARAAK